MRVFQTVTTVTRTSPLVPLEQSDVEGYSVLDNQKNSDVFSAQIMATLADQVLDLRTGSKVTAVKAFATDGSYWANLKELTLLFKLINRIVKFMERDCVTISYVL